MLKDIKHQFLAYRNGIVADSLRKAGFPHKIIFGVQLPQIAEIARSHELSMELAEALWRDESVRESRLLASYLFPPEEVDIEKAVELAEEVNTAEEADILTFRLLRRLPYFGELKSVLAERNPEAYIIKAIERFE
ncbi:MAG: DNA alkylation repair protein [Muribaculaceae bacterium]|nr:DNA alkylation repair protein [Muribaculaceae bacterium]